MKNMTKSSQQVSEFGNFLGISAFNCATILIKNICVNRVRSTLQIWYKENSYIVSDWEKN